MHYDFMLTLVWTKIKIQCTFNNKQKAKYYYKRKHWILFSIYWFFNHGFTWHCLRVGKRHSIYFHCYFSLDRPDFSLWLARTQTNPLPSLTATINNILTDSLLPIASTSHHWSIYNAARPYKLTTGIPYLFDKWHLILTVFIYSYNWFSFTYFWTVDGCFEGLHLYFAGVSGPDKVIYSPLDYVEVLACSVTTIKITES